MHRSIALLSLLACGPKVPPPAEPAPAPEIPSGKLGPEATASQKYAADFQALWLVISQRYCCMADKATDWNRVQAELGPKAAAATTDLDFLKVVEQALDQLYDPATDLLNPPASSWRPRSLDMWAQWRDGQAVLVGVKRGSAAASQAIRAGRVVDKVDAQPVSEAVAARKPTMVTREDPAAADWALRSLLAGRFNRVRELETHLLKGGDARFTTTKELGPIEEPSVAREAWGSAALLVVNRFDDAAAFDLVLDAVGSSTPLVIDVRDNHDGDIEVVKQVLGRFAKTSATALFAEGPGAKAPLSVAPRGAWQVSAPVIVLVDYWTVGAAEAFAVAMDAMGAARIVGTPMGGEAVVTETFTLPNTEYDVEIATARWEHPNGTRASAFVPGTVVDLALAPYGDPIADAAKAALD